MNFLNSVFCACAQSAMYGRPIARDRAVLEALGGQLLSCGDRLEASNALMAVSPEVSQEIVKIINWEFDTDYTAPVEVSQLASRRDAVQTVDSQEIFWGAVKVYLDGHGVLTSRDALLEAGAQYAEIYRGIVPLSWRKIPREIGDQIVGYIDWNFSVKIENPID